MTKQFWSKARVGVVGAGSFGGVLAKLAAKNVASVDLLFRSPAAAAQFETDHKLPKKPQWEALPQNVRGIGSIDQLFDSKNEPSLALILWALPANSTREVAQKMAPFLTDSTLLIHAVKGLDDSALMMSQVFSEELPLQKVGFLGGPHLAEEVFRGLPTAAVIASFSERVQQAARFVLGCESFQVIGIADMAGAQWCSVYKNVIAMALGLLEGACASSNLRGVLVTAALAELGFIVSRSQGQVQTVYGLAGLGDMLATGFSNKSRNYRFGLGIGQGKPVHVVLEAIQETVEGIKSVRLIEEMAIERRFQLPIVSAMAYILDKAEGTRLDIAGVLAKAAHDVFSGERLGQIEKAFPS